MYLYINKRKIYNIKLNIYKKMKNLKFKLKYTINININFIYIY